MITLSKRSATKHRKKPEMTSTILFLCPHHAAKSVIAQAYFNRLAQQKNLPFVADSAGTEPDAVVAPVVADMLLSEGMDVRDHQPRRVTAIELDQAARVISIGCALTDLEIAPERVESWDDVPMVSKDLAGASATILRHIETLVEELSERGARI
jgi:arsenate reductase (thioredoxin)